MKTPEPLPRYGSLSGKGFDARTQLQNVRPALIGYGDLQRFRQNAGSGWAVKFTHRSQYVPTKHTNGAEQG
jgi:hypothetical protein